MSYAIELNNSMSRLNHEREHVNIIKEAEEKKRLRDQRLYNLLPLISLPLAIAVDIGVERSFLQAPVDKPYFSLLLIFLLVGYLIMQIGGRFIPALAGWRQKAELWARFLAGLVLLLNIINILTTKLALLPPLYFPAIDRVLAVVLDDADYLAKCTVYSYRLLLMGWFFGSVSGFATAVLIGFNKNAKYWLQPFIKVLGPIPTSAWIPLVLVAFPSVVGGSVFLIALAVLHLYREAMMLC